ncbi:MAG TPA: cyanophycin synthetase, partial [Pyrinomonadaceae bacterium]
NERIRLEGREISRQDFARLATRVRAEAETLLDQGRLETLPTFFEHLTAIALLAFSEKQVRLAILETGLGGRLDATTAARASIAAITPIALDHQEFLGQTLSQIAAEKAAIIRPGMTAIISPQPPAALEAILKHCADSGVQPRLDECAALIHGAEEMGRVRATFRTRHDVYENVLLALRGRHQVINASVTIQLAEALREHGFRIAREDIISGLETARHAGRLEWLAGSPAILFDGAHNVAGAHALREFLSEFVHAPLTLVFGAMRDKELDQIAAELFPLARRLILTAPANPRAAAPEALALAVPNGFDSSRIQLAANTGEALGLARRETPPDGVICITGSLYLVGEAQSILNSV